MRLRDRVVIITGSGSGIGRGGALLFAREGAKVVVADIDPEGGEETQRLVEAAGGEAFFVQTDVSQCSQVERLVNVTLERFGRVDILWNNAAPVKLFNEEDRAVHELPEGVWDRMLNVVLKGTYLCSKYVLPNMMANRRGVIINTSSVHALMGEPGYDSYNAAKGGINSLTKSMAVCYAPYNIRVNAIAPGFVLTPGTERYVRDPKSRREVEAWHLTRLGAPEDIARFAVYLASEDAEYITGVIFPIDGGYTTFKCRPLAAGKEP
jgi:NAD(P)-dependent dehydrogenase (short-subunit alcohol dehydrogenase family)